MQRMTHVLSRMLNDPMTRAALNIGGDDPDANQGTHSPEGQNAESTIDEGEGGSGTLQNFNILLSESGEEATTSQFGPNTTDNTNSVDVSDAENVRELTTSTSTVDKNSSRSRNNEDEISAVSNNDR